MKEVGTFTVIIKVISHPLILMNEGKIQMKNVAKKPYDNQMVKVLLGILLCLIITLIAIYGAHVIGNFLIFTKIMPEGSASPVSGIFVAILIGMIIRNTIGLHHIFIDGVAFSLKYALRVGIILLGLRLSLVEALKLGAWGLPLIIVCITCGLLVTLF